MNVRDVRCESRDVDREKVITQSHRKDRVIARRIRLNLLEQSSVRGFQLNDDVRDRNP